MPRMTERTMRTPLIRSLALAVPIALLVLGCSGQPGATATAQVSSPTPSPETPTDTDGGLPTFELPSFSGDQELEDLLPDELGGTDVDKISLTGAEFVQLGNPASPELQTLLNTLGKQPSDLSVAFGSAGSMTLIAYRIKGVPGDAILTSILSAYQATQDSTATDVSFAGKTVKKFVPSDPTGDIVYVRTAGDAVFVVGGEDLTDALLTEAFSKLP
jgi:hypothetical protein